jgi:hypothetical protein
MFNFSYFLQHNLQTSGLTLPAVHWGAAEWMCWTVYIITTNSPPPENCVLLCYCAGRSVNSLPPPVTEVRDNFSCTLQHNVMTCRISITNKINCKLKSTSPVLRVWPSGRTNKLNLNWTELKFNLTETGLKPSWNLIWTELNWNKLKLNWSWNWTELNWNWTEIKFTETELNWNWTETELRLSWTNWNWTETELKLKWNSTETELNWKWSELNWNWTKLNWTVPFIVPFIFWGSLLVSTWLWQQYILKYLVCGLQWEPRLENWSGKLIVHLSQSSVNEMRHMGWPLCQVPERGISHTSSWQVRTFYAVRTLVS